MRISRFENIFAKGYAPNWSEEVFVIKKFKNTVSWTYMIKELNGEEIAGIFYEKELQKKNQTEFKIEKVIKKKGFDIFDLAAKLDLFSLYVEVNKMNIDKLKTVPVDFK